MSTIINIAIPRAVAEPRGAIWIGRLADSLRILFAPRHGGAVEAAERARDAASIRGYANSLRDQDPGMAADLNAAVDRDSR